MQIGRQTSTWSLFTRNCKETYNSESKRSFVLITKYASETVGERNWNNIQWQEVRKTVRLLQERIVKAKQKCNAVLFKEINNI